MTIRQIAACAGFVALVGAMIVTSEQPTQALTMKECSAKYQAAKSAGTLNGQNWRDFRKAQCGPDATAAAPAAGAPASTPATAPRASGNAVFPTAIAPKYSSESAGKARMHTCLDQYNANKASNANGGLKWIQKGGGYYSECNKQLKG
ncbi:MAG: hypothetical protein JO049_09130 [Hyphomicrobiales bacterium]|jgi:hypothetical protein|nr:hypothetical protein [Hyphomicrobiales bacterium]